MRYTVEFIGKEIEKGEEIEVSLGTRNINWYGPSKWKEGPQTKEALAFRKASRKQLEAHKLKFWKAEDLPFWRFR